MLKTNVYSLAISVFFRFYISIKYFHTLQRQSNHSNPYKKDTLTSFRELIQTLGASNGHIHMR